MRLVEFMLTSMGGYTQGQPMPLAWLTPPSLLFLHRATLLMVNAPSISSLQPNTPLHVIKYSASVFYDSKGNVEDRFARGTQ